jgi:hypothetical protein
LKQGVMTEIRRMGKNITPPPPPRSYDSWDHLQL